MCACVSINGFLSLCVCLGGGVSLGPSCLSLNPPLGQLTQQIFSCKEKPVPFGPLYGNLEQIPSGFTTIIQNGFKEVLNLRYVDITVHVETVEKEACVV